MKLKNVRSAVVASLLVSSNALAWEVTISCTLPTARVDETSLAAEEIDRAVFRIASCTGDAQEFESPTCSLVTTVEAEPCNISAAVVDTDGLMSDFMPAVMEVKHRPKPPTGVTAVSIDR